MAILLLSDGTPVRIVIAARVGAPESFEDHRDHLGHQGEFAHTTTVTLPAVTTKPISTRSLT